MPIAPPIALPRDLFIRAYIPPPPIVFRFVAISDIENIVAKVTVWARTTIISILIRPRSAVSTGRSKKRTVPNMPSVEGTNTPLKVPNFIGPAMFLSVNLLS